MTAPVPPAPAVSQRPGGRFRSLLADSLFVLCACLVALIGVTVRGAVHGAEAKRAGELVARAVLKTGIAAPAAEQLADDIRREEPGTIVKVVSPDAVRSRLALQETWLQQTPEVDLGELPLVLELTHPRMLENPEMVATFHARVERRPQIDFLQFNSLGYELFQKEARRMLRAGILCEAALCSAAALALLIYTFGGRAAAAAITQMKEARARTPGLAPTFAPAFLGWAAAIGLFIASRDWLSGGGATAFPNAFSTESLLILAAAVLLRTPLLIPHRTTRRYAAAQQPVTQLPPLRRTTPRKRIVESPGSKA